MTEHCPKCGGESGYLVKVRVIGSVIHRGEWSGEEKLIDTSGLRSVAAKTVKCCDCGERMLTKNLRTQ